MAKNNRSEVHLAMSGDVSHNQVFLKVASSIRLLGAELEERMVFTRLRIWLVRNGFFWNKNYMFPVIKYLLRERFQKNGRVLSYD